MNGGGGEPPVLQLVPYALEPPELTVQIVAPEHHLDAVGGDQLEVSLAELDLGQTPAARTTRCVGVGDPQPLADAARGAGRVLLCPLAVSPVSSGRSSVSAGVTRLNGAPSASTT